MSESKYQYWSRQTLRERESRILIDWGKERNSKNYKVGELEAENEQLVRMLTELIENPSELEIKYAKEKLKQIGKS